MADDLKKKLVDAKSVFAKAFQKHRDICDAKYERKKFMLDAVDQQIEQEFGEQERSAREASDKLWSVVQAIEGEIALQSTEHKYAPGTVLIQWSYPRYTGGERKPVAKGIAEVWTNNSPSIGKTSPPSIGKLIVRYLRKDGTPGARIDRWGVDGWYPEGVDPNKKSN